MKKIKLLTSLSTLPILGMACVPLTSCKAKIGEYTITNSSSSAVTFTDLKESWKEGDGDISATYTITDSNVQFDENDCDILVGGISIISLDGVEYKNGILKIPSKYIISNITIKIETCVNPGELDNSLSDIIAACNEYEGTSRTKDRQKEFAEKFSINGNQLKSITPLIGSTFKITINGKEHVVRIIGFEHDEMYNETTKLTTGKAALTCELETLLSYASGNAMKSPWSSLYNFDYTNSILRWNLNGTGTEPSSGKWESTAFDLIKTGNPDLENGIKTVQKTVGIYSPENAGLNFVVTGYSDKLFPLSYTEMGGTDRSEGKVEGSVYKYWESLRAYKNYRIKKDCNGNSVNYWLRSPYANSIVPYTEDAFYVDDDGDLMAYKHYVTDSIAPSIAFCI